MSAMPLTAARKRTSRDFRVVPKGDVCSFRPTGWAMVGVKHLLSPGTVSYLTVRAQRCERTQSEMALGQSSLP
jgi:hypothetical protein